MRKPSSPQTPSGSVHNCCASDKNPTCSVHEFACCAGGVWLPSTIGFVNTISRREELSDFICNPDCYAAVTIVILEAILARAHVVFAHFAGMEGSIDSYGRHILTISKLLE